MHTKETPARRAAETGDKHVVDNNFTTPNVTLRDYQRDAVNACLTSFDDTARLAAVQNDLRPEQVVASLLDAIDRAIDEGNSAHARRALDVLRDTWLPRLAVECRTEAA